MINYGTGEKVSAAKARRHIRLLSVRKQNAYSRLWTPPITKYTVESSQDAPTNAMSEADTFPIPSEGHFSFDEIFDAELLSLLPFNLDTDMPFEPTA